MAGYFARSIPASRCIPAGQAELASGARRQRRCRAGTIDRMNDDPGHVFQRSHHTRPADAGVAPRTLKRIAMSHVQSVFGVFFFVTLFVQDVWGYSALRTGVAFLPLTVAVLAASGAATPLVQRVGARPLLLTGSAACAGGLYWLSGVTEHSTYTGGLLGPTLIIGAGLGLLFVPLPLVALARVADADSGVASSLLNAGRQVGGSIGLAVLGSVAWTVVADSARAAAASQAASASSTAWRAAYQHALAAGFDRAFLIAAGIAALLLVTTIAAIRIRRADLAGG
jgi:Na+/melibiose symporter-like transporter